MFKLDDNISAAETVMIGAQFVAMFENKSTLFRKVLRSFDEYVVGDFTKALVRIKGYFFAKMQFQACGKG